MKEHIYIYVHIYIEMWADLSFKSENMFYV